MRFYYFQIVVLLLLFKPSTAQKRTLSANCSDQWSKISVPVLSNDGNYVFFDSTENKLYGRSVKKIVSTESEWTFECRGHIRDFYFSPDSKYAVFINEHDSLNIIQLRTSNVRFVPNISQVNESMNGSNISYFKSGNSKALYFFDLKSGKESKLYGENFIFDNKRSVVLYITRDSINGLKYSLNVYDIPLNYHGVILKTDLVPNDLQFVKDRSSKQIVFSFNRSDSGNYVQVWHYEYGKEFARLLFTDSVLFREKLCFSSLVDFPNNSGGIFIRVKDLSRDDLKTWKANVDVWSYLDKEPQTLQHEQLKNSREYLCIIRFSDKNFLRIENDREYCFLRFSNAFNDTNLILVKRGLGDVLTEWYWNSSALSDIYLVSVQDGTRKKIKSGVVEKETYNYKLSPSGRYVLFFDSEDRNYYSYDVLNNKMKNLTVNIETVWTSFFHNDVYTGKYEIIGPPCFIENTDEVLIYDQTDVWKIDLSGRHKPVNITDGYGKENGIFFRLLRMYDLDNILINGKADLLLTAFSRVNKNDGFFKISQTKVSQPKLLSFGPYVYAGSDETDNANCFAPIKAINGRKYLIRRMSAVESPNYFITSDFMEFKQITFNYPERSYNWLTTELITWKTGDTSFSQGILYKPEDFDSTKTYPMIIYYYERESDELNLFIRPSLCTGALNIPYYVSNQYLVFVPDFHFTIGEPGNSVLLAVNSAVDTLIRRKYINKEKIGLQGHSRGGFETNYLITHSNRFAAAFSGSGYCDMFSLYNGLSYRGMSRQAGTEVMAQRLGGDLWSSLNNYIMNSPVLAANKITTPLLMMNNKDDHDIPFSQGIEFFLALRRLGKRVWMLQYDEQDHVLSGSSAAALDLTIRSAQFFDHYLKDKPAPLWMTRGIPAKEKGVENGFQYDSLIVSPPIGGLINTR